MYIVNYPFCWLLWQLTKIISAEMMSSYFKYILRKYVIHQKDIYLNTERFNIFLNNVMNVYTCMLSNWIKYTARLNVCFLKCYLSGRFCLYSETCRAWFYLNLASQWCLQRLDKVMIKIRLCIKNLRSLRFEWFLIIYRFFSLKL